MILLISKSLIEGIYPILSLLLTQKMINFIQLKNTSLTNIILLLITISILGLLETILLSFINLSIANRELKFDSYMQSKILQKVSGLSSKEFESSLTYNLVSRTQYDSSKGIMDNIKTLFDVISSTIGIISYIMIILKLNPIILIVVLIVPCIRYIFEKKYNLLEYEMIKNNTEKNRKASYLSYIITDAEYFKEIKIFSLFNHFIDRFKKLKHSVNNSMIKIYNKRTLIFTSLNLFESILDFVIMLKMVKSTFLGNLLIGEFILYSNSLNNIRENIIRIFS